MADRPEFSKKGGPRRPADSPSPETEVGAGGRLAGLGDTLQGLPLGWIALTGAGVLALGAAMSDTRPRCEPNQQRPPGVQAPATPKPGQQPAQPQPSQEDCRTGGRGGGFFGPRFFPRGLYQSAGGTDTSQQQSVNRGGFGKSGGWFSGGG